jgi:hypothetical protein
MFRRLKAARGLLVLKTASCLLASVSLLFATVALAEQDSARAATNKFLLQVSDDEIRQLPKPSFRPLSSEPNYARTAMQCDGDPRILMFLVDQLQFVKERGKQNAHAVAEGFISVTLSKEDENSIDVVDLSARALDQLRTRLKIRARELEKFASELHNSFIFVGFPITAELAGAVIGARVFAWVVWGADATISETVAKETSTERDHLILLAALLQSQAQLIRSTVPIKSPSGQEYVRYQYIVQPSMGEPTVLNSCVYARK